MRNAFLFFLALSGFCPQAALAAPSPTGRTVVTYWEKWTGAEMDGMQAVVDDFNASQDRIFVEMVPTTGLDRKTMIATAGGVPPDIAGLWDENVASFAEKGILAPLDERLAKAHLGAKDYVPAIWDTLQHQGHTYALVSTPFSIALHWNKKLFREAGLDPERPPKTLAEMLEYSKKLTRVDPASGAIKQFGFMGAEPGWWHYGWGYIFGGRLWDGDKRITADDPRNVAALEYVISFTQPYDPQAVQDFRSGFGNFASSQNPFLNGQLAMQFQGVWMANYIQLYAPKLEWGAAPFPVLKAGDAPTTFVGCDMLCIPRGAKHPDEAFEFMAYVNRQGPMEKLCLSHRKTSPLRQVSDHFYQAHKNPYIRMFQQLQWSPGAVSTPKMAIFTEYYDELKANFNRVWLRQQTPAEGLRDTQQRIQRAWDRELERKGHPPSESLLYAPLSLSFLIALGLACVVWWREKEERRLNPSGRMRNKLWLGLLFAAPGLAGLLVFIIYPVASAFIYSFCDYNVLTTPRWIGLANFRELGADSLFWLSLRNTLYYSALALPLGLLSALCAALLLDSNVRGTTTYRTLFFLPVVTPLVANAMVWMWIFNSQFGVLNHLLGLLSFGLIKPIPWLTSASWTVPSLAIMSLWGLGHSAVIMLAALQEVPVAIYEAADLDGAGWWGKIWHISVPSIAPVIYFNLVMGVINSLQIFAQPYIMLNENGTISGGPGRSAYMYTMYMWDNAFGYLRMGYASALAWILFLIILGLNLFFTRLTRSKITYAGGK
jgi:ABC-type sugar transport system permease subunit/ABC-type glycerol-3-phosphate transport system substrate-binding protein